MPKPTSLLLATFDSDIGPSYNTHHCWRGNDSPFEFQYKRSLAFEDCARRDLLWTALYDMGSNVEVDISFLLGALRELSTTPSPRKLELVFVDCAMDVIGGNLDVMAKASPIEFRVALQHITSMTNDGFRPPFPSVHPSIEEADWDITPAVQDDWRALCENATRIQDLKFGCKNWSTSELAGNVWSLCHFPALRDLRIGSDILWSLGHRGSSTTHYREVHPSVLRSCLPS
jgi:hypothetical protein